MVSPRSWAMWMHDSLSAAAVKLWYETPWQLGLCRSHWLPVAAWFPDGRSRTYQYDGTEPWSVLIEACEKRGIVPEHSRLLTAARIHLHDVPDTGMLGQNSPCSEAAIEVCLRCPIQDACREYAIVAHEPGIWGGSKDRERRDERSTRWRQRRHRRG